LIILYRIAGLKTSIACIKLLDATQIATKVIPQCSILLLDKSNDVRMLALSLMDSCLSQMKEYHQIVTEQMEKERMKGNSEKVGATTGGNESFSNKGNSSSNQSSSTTAGILSSPISESIMNLGWTSWLSSSASTVKAGETLDTNNATALNSNPMGSPLSSSTNLSSMEQLAPKDYSRNSSSASLSQSGKQQSFSSSKPATAVSVVSSKGWDDDNIDADLDLDLDDEEENPSVAAVVVDNGKKKSSGDKDFFNDFEEETLTSKNKPPTFGMTEKNKFEKSPKPVSSNSSKGSKSAIASKVAVKKLEFSKDEGWDDF
jgi:hypothetical protein